MPPLHVVLRTCDRNSLNSDRVVEKVECIKRCLRSLIEALSQYTGEYTLTIIDDRSSNITVSNIREIAPHANFIQLPERDDSSLNGKQKAQYSKRYAYKYIERFAKDDLIYMLEDDYLHIPNAITLMMDAWNYFTSLNLASSVVIFPQDFPELYLHPRNKFNSVYVKPCFTIPGPDRYYRTTWFTQETFLIPHKVINEFKRHFDDLCSIGDTEGAWEGSTISNVWSSGDVMVLMPMKTLAVHMSKKDDEPFFDCNVDDLWEMYK